MTKPPKVLWIWDWDERLKWTEVLFKTENGLVVVRFGDETLPRGCYPRGGGREPRPTDTCFRHQVFGEDYVTKEMFKELAEVYRNTDRSKLALKESYNTRYYNKCMRGWSLSYDNIGLTLIPDPIL